MQRVIHNGIGPHRHSKQCVYSVCVCVYAGMCMRVLRMGVCDYECVSGCSGPTTPPNMRSTCCILAPVAVVLWCLWWVAGPGSGAGADPCLVESVIQICWCLGLLTSSWGWECAVSDLLVLAPLLFCPWGGITVVHIMGGPLVCSALWRVIGWSVYLCRLWPAAWIGSGWGCGVPVSLIGKPSRRLTHTTHRHISSVTLTHTISVCTNI